MSEEGHPSIRKDEVTVDRTGILNKTGYFTLVFIVYGIGLSSIVSGEHPFCKKKEEMVLLSDRFFPRKSDTGSYFYCTSS